jgi:hypothetical protein
MMQEVGPKMTKLKSLIRDLHVCFTQQNHFLHYGYFCTWHHLCSMQQGIVLTRDAYDISAFFLYSSRSTLVRRPKSEYTEILEFMREVVRTHWLLHIYRYCLLFEFFHFLDMHHCSLSYKKLGKIFSTHYANLVVYVIQARLLNF